MSAATKILIAIIDDDKSVCRALERLVRSLGLEARTFGSGQAFLELIEALPAFQPDCVVLDLQMPTMNGLEVQRHLRAERPRTPVIFITAHDEYGVRERAIAGGATAYLRKPFNEQTFIQTLQAALSGQLASVSAHKHLS